MVDELIDVAGDARAFALEEGLDRAREPWVREPVRRKRLHRQQAAEELVLALRAAFEGGYFPADRVLDRLVVAALAMQQRQVLHRAQEADVESVPVWQAE